MRKTLSVLTVSLLLAGVPSFAQAQQKQDESELRTRVSDMIRDRERARTESKRSASKDDKKDDKWDWNRARDKDRDDRRDRDRDRQRELERARERARDRADSRYGHDNRRYDDRRYGNRGYGNRGYDYRNYDGWGVDDRREFEKRDRDFTKRTRRWNATQWRMFENCTDDMRRRLRRDQVDTRREEILQRDRIRDYCERRVRDWRR